MDLINFKVGYKTISLKILDILLTEQFNNNLTILPNENKSFLGVKDYMGVPTPVFDLGILLNGRSTESSNLQTLKQLKDGQKKLMDWFTELEEQLKKAHTTSTIIKYHPTDFENFYINFKTDSDELKKNMSRFNQLFIALQTKIVDLIESLKSNDGQKLISQIDKIKRNELIQLERLFESAIEEITLDYKPIIVFTTKDGTAPHVGLLVDKVEDNIEYKQEDIKPLDKVTSIGFDIDPQTKNMMIGLIKLTDKHSLLIEPSAIFQPVNETSSLVENEQETQPYGLF